jgi:hypothetical protein
MSPALRALLAESLDYAGLFPPARLELSEALRLYETHRQGLARAIVNRFVIPASRLKELPDDCLAPLAVIGHEGPWPEAREADAAAMNAHLDRFGDNAPIEAFEVKLASPGAFLQEWLADLERFGAEETYLELSIEDPAHTAEILAALAESDGLGAKARLGPHPPEPKHLTAFLLGCLHLEVPFKLTAGLRHPFPGPDRYGFLSVFGTASLILGADLNQEQAARALAAPIEEWRFEDDQIGWRNHVADLEAIVEARNLLAGFGSCSIDEPFGDLTALGLWPF